jgi:hypothetical protein
MFRTFIARLPIILVTAVTLQASADIGEPTGDVLRVGLGPCHWAKVCAKWSGTNAQHPFPHCLAWEHKKVCNPGSEKPENKPSKIHVPPFQRRLPAFGPQTPSLRRAR